MQKILYSLLVLATSFAISNSAVAVEEVRTSAINVKGDYVGVEQRHFPAHLSPLTKKSYPNWSSNPKTDPQFYKYRHPQQWRGLEWDTSKWPSNMTEKTVLREMYHSHIFTRQYVTDKGSPVVEVGEKFYKLSDLDRRRSLKLLADYFDFFENGNIAFEVRDWREGIKIGEYNKYGFQPE